MSREQILAALAQVNDAIASLNIRLHPPPVDPVQRQELESELVAAEQSRDALEQALANLPPPAQDSALASSLKLQADAAIEMSKSVRQNADTIAGMVEPVNGPTARGGIKKKAKK